MITRTKARDQGIEVSANATNSDKSSNAVNDALTPPPSKMSPSSTPYSLSKEDEMVESVEGSSLSIIQKGRRTKSWWKQQKSRISSRKARGVM